MIFTPYQCRTCGGVDGSTIAAAMNGDDSPQCDRCFMGLAPKWTPPNTTKRSRPETARP